MLHEDYFSSGSRLAPGMRPRSPFPGMAEYGQDGQYSGGGMFGTGERSLEKMAQTVNMYA